MSKKYNEMSAREIAIGFANFLGDYICKPNKTWVGGNYTPHEDEITTEELFDKYINTLK